MYLPDGIYSDEEDSDGFECSSPRINGRSPINFQKVEDDQNNKETAVEVAASTGDLTTLKKILENGSNINIDLCLNESWTALMHASFNVQFEVVKYLLDSGANPNAHCSSVTPLICLCSYTGAAEEIQLQCLQLLIEKGALINMGDKFGLTPLMKLVEFGRVRLMEQLISLGANIEMRDSQGWTAIFWAVHHGKEDTVRLLAEKGARTQEVDKRGRCLSDLALTEYHQPVVDFLKSFQKTDEDENTEKRQLLEDTKTWKDFFPGISVSDNQLEYSAEIPTLLYGMHCEHLIPLFSKEKTPLRKFLLLDENTMKKIGVQLPYERRRLKIGLYKFHQAKWQMESVAGLTAIKMTHFDIMESLNTLGSHMRQLYILEASVQYTITNFVNPVIKTTTNDKEDILEIDNELKKGVKELSTNLTSLKKEIKFFKVQLQKMQARNPPPVDLIQTARTNNQCNQCFAARTLLFTGFSVIVGYTLANHLIRLKFV